jgi:hypothetical protein
MALRGRCLARRCPAQTPDDSIVRPAAAPFSPTGGLQAAAGQSGPRGDQGLGRARRPPRGAGARRGCSTARRRCTQAFQAGELDRDVVVVVRFQGPQANGMPELHKLTPPLAVLQEGPPRGAGHRRPHERRQRQGAGGHPRQPRGAGRRRRWPACAMATSSAWTPWPARWSAGRRPPTWAARTLAGAAPCRPGADARPRPGPRALRRPAPQRAQRRARRHHLAVTLALSSDDGAAAACPRFRTRMTDTQPGQPRPRHPRHRAAARAGRRAPGARPCWPAA